MKINSLEWFKKFYKLLKTHLIDKKYNDINKSCEIVDIQKNGYTLGKLMNNAESKMDEALQHVNNVENNIGNKVTEILNAEYCMGSFMAYVEIIDSININKYVELGEKTREAREKVLKTINEIYGIN